MILVFDSINLDPAAKASRLPAPGETMLGEPYVTAPGGKGANQALAARRAGASVGLIGPVERDAFAEPALANVRAGVGATHRGGHALRGVRPAGNRRERALGLTPRSVALADDPEHVQSRGHCQQKQQNARPHGAVSGQSLLPPH